MRIKVHVFAVQIRTLVGDGSALMAYRQHASVARIYIIIKELACHWSLEVLALTDILKMAMDTYMKGAAVGRIILNN